jgi:hypothetical protein
MIFSIQRDLEDYFNRCGLTDPDQYAIAVATLYDRQRQKKDKNAFLSSMARLRTVFFRTNSGVQRATFERKVLVHLDVKFKKKVYSSFPKPSLRELKRRGNGSLVFHA